MDKKTAENASSRTAQTRQAMSQCPQEGCEGNLEFVGTDTRHGVLIYACNRRGCTIRILNSYVR